MKTNLAIASPEMDTGLSKVQATINAIQVTDHDTCLKAKLVRVFVRERWLKPLETVNKALMNRIRDYEQKEREAADEEALRLNRDRGVEEAPLEVEPAIPTVAGAPSRVPTVPKLTPAKLQARAEAVADAIVNAKHYRSRTAFRAFIINVVKREFGDR